MRSLILIFFILTIAQSSHAFIWKDTNVELNLGYCYDTTIINPDNTTAYYKGYGFLGRVTVPIYSQSRGLKTSTITDFSKTFKIGALIDFKRLYFENTNEGTTSEKAEHTGPSAGVFLRFGGFYLATSYGMIKAQHTTNGALQGSTSFDYNPIMYEGGLLFPVADNIELGLTYSFINADISKGDTGLDKDSPYSEQMIWFKFNLHFNK